MSDFSESERQLLCICLPSEGHHTNLCSTALVGARAVLNERENDAPLEVDLEPLDTGWFCNGCGWFEADDPSEGKDRCGSCGCQHDEHVKAKVVVDE